MGYNKDIDSFLSDSLQPQEKEHFYSQVIQHLPGAFYICNSEGYITYSNQKAALFWGHEPVPGKSMWCGSWKTYRVDGSPLPLEECPMSIALKEEREVEESEIVIERPDGTRMNILTHPRPVFDKSGKLTGAFNIMMDITGRKEAEQRIAENEHFLQRLIAGSNDCIKVLDLDGKFISMNNYGQQLLEVKDFSLLKGTWYPDVWKGRNKEAAIKAIRIAQKGGTGKFTGFFPTLETKTPKWWHIIINPILDSEGNPEKLLAVSRDITEQKELEDRLRRKNTYLKISNEVGRIVSSELQLDKVVQKVTDAATQVAGAEFGAFFYNPENEKGEFYTLYSISGAPKEAFSKFPLPRKTEIFAPTFEGQQIIRVDDITKDPRYGKTPPYNGIPEGHLPVVSYLAVPVVSRSGEVLGGLFFGHSKPGVFTSLTEDIIAGIAAQTAIAIDNSKLYEASKSDKERLAKINAELNRKNKELHKTNRDFDNFIYTASHELSPPVSNIEGLIATMADYMNNRKVQGINKGDIIDISLESILQMMDESIVRFKNILMNLIEISKAQKLREDYIYEISCDEIIENVKHSIHDKISAAEAEIDVDISSCEYIRFSRKNFTSIIYNLLSNAVRYRNPHKKLKVYISMFQEKEYNVLLVQDNGLGISEKNKKKLFTMFKRFHDHVEGTGIGLYIVKQIVDNAGGKIEVDSEVDKGTTFKIFFKK